MPTFRSCTEPKRTRGRLLLPTGGPTGSVVCFTLGCVAGATGPSAPAPAPPPAPTPSTTGSAVDAMLCLLQNALLNKRYCPNSLTDEIGCCCGARMVAIKLDPRIYKIRTKKIAFEQEQHSRAIVLCATMSIAVDFVREAALRAESEAHDAAVWKTSAFCGQFADAFIEATDLAQGATGASVRHYLKVATLYCLSHPPPPPPSLTHTPPAPSSGCSTCSSSRCFYR